MPVLGDVFAEMRDLCGIGDGDEPEALAGVEIDAVDSVLGGGADVSVAVGDAGVAVAGAQPFEA